ncbi:tryptophan 2,3-dioxygenase [Streptomonospora nanhaiensis]|uniref:Tryptophan 2,3-dioxygenase n=1 Tax=Streptomonospora nanhaiensis TaxID=1323731 RepID=A0A853BSL2_9ACTN|nr:tryptophan 2,3-dioxygenase family protein [Streptomonospora nanhaiensis]MBV2363713.1 tryptophan 2,3-dioxygenase [Streptomonospora nanhaiensis]MBX9391416.1 tryptophan 2,3-dioxygenase [Streptomonospora nanhaiensis]NYI98759.1 tryptophan 2,3-dioxygenase [Streptomonospora nanhaiensis]
MAVAAAAHDRDAAGGGTGAAGACPLEAADRAAAYADYVRTETLLDLQRPRTGEPAELSFIIATQVMELLFTLVRQHWTAARDALEADDAEAAIAALRRGTGAQDVLVESWALLGTLTPAEFDRFRDSLGVASGVQSPGYRHLEFLLGNKSAGMIRPFRGQPDVHRDLERALAEPGLYDAALRLLHRRGLGVPAAAADRDWRRPYTPHPDVEKAWARVYADDRPGNELLRLAEALVDTAERVTRWRHRHLMAVKRAMGAKPGTGGSTGLDWLARNAGQDVFPELWSLRTAL